jgi:hypothetical protein
MADMVDAVKTVRDAQPVSHDVDAALSEAETRALLQRLGMVECPPLQQVCWRWRCARSAALRARMCYVPTHFT